MLDMGLGMVVYFYGGDLEVDEFIVLIKVVDQCYLSIYGLELVVGWDIIFLEVQCMGDLYFSENEVCFVVVNVVLGKILGIIDLQEFLGKKVVVYINNFIGEIVGVVKDFNISFLREEIEFMMIILMLFQYNIIGV